VSQGLAVLESLTRPDFAASVRDRSVWTRIVEGEQVVDIGCVRTARSVTATIDMGLQFRCRFGGATAARLNLGHMDWLSDLQSSEIT
jgi:hypothetical protein